MQFFLFSRGLCRTGSAIVQFCISTKCHLDQVPLLQAQHERKDDFFQFMKMTRWCLLSTPFTHRDITTAIASKAKRMSIFCFHCRCKAVIICLGFFHLRVIIFNVQFAAVFKQSSLFDFPVTFFHCTAKLSYDISNNANKIL